jgi:four helix bundle protein
MMESDLMLLEESVSKYGEINSFRDLIVWQKSMQLVVGIYEITKKMPIEEKYGLTNQLRRAVVSVPSNIAEGWGRKSRGHYIQFLRIASGSLCETDTQLELAVRLSYFQEKDVVSLKGQLLEMEKMLRSLISKLELKNN